MYRVQKTQVWKTRVIMQNVGSHAKRGYGKRGLSWKTRVWKMRVIGKTRVVMENTGISEFSLMNTTS